MRALTGTAYNDVLTPLRGPFQGPQVHNGTSAERDQYMVRSVRGEASVSICPVTMFAWLNQVEEKWCTVASFWPTKID